MSHIYDTLNGIFFAGSPIVIIFSVEISPNKGWKFVWEGGEMKVVLSSDFDRKLNAL